MPKSVSLAQRANFEALKRMLRNYKKDSKDRHNRGYFEARLQRLSELWDDCTKNHPVQLQETSESKELQDQYKAEYDEAEELSMDLLTIFKNGYNEFTQIEIEEATVNRPIEDAVVAANDNNSIRLERIMLPKFDGSYNKWRTFIDLFTSMVDHNPRISPVEKMQYLKTHLVGDAARVVQHLDINNDNYESTKELLMKRFDNKRAIAWNHLQTFFGLPVAKEERDSSIKNLMDSTAELIANIKSVGIDTSSWDLLIIYVICQKLDFQTRKLWESSLGSSSEIPTLNNFIEFLTGRFRTLEALELPKRSSKPHSTSMTVTELQSCSLCNKHHYINHCEGFKAMNLGQRRDHVKKHNLCFNCLKKGHGSNQCPSSNRCHTCSKKHHTLLHYDLKPNNAAPAPTANTLLAENQLQDKPILLATAQVKIRSSTGENMLFRALIDSGSQRTFITESAAQYLGLKRQYNKINVSGLGAASTMQTNGSISLLIQAKNSQRNIKVAALIIPKITNICPPVRTNVKIPKNLKYDELADPTCGNPGQIDVLFGADIYNSLILDGFKRGLPCAINTVLGWVLLGPTSTSRSQKNVISMISTEDKTEELMKQFWEIEEVDNKKPLTTDEKLAEEFYKTSTRREYSGKYVVKLPFRNNAQPELKLRDSRQIAQMRFAQLEKRLASDDSLRQQYSTFLREYQELGHMIEVPAKEIYSSHCYYMPHHPVLKEDSSTTKLRVVFNASQAAKTSVSLNDLLLAGPNIQNNIVQLLLKWRKHKFVIAADIEKMYRQIKIDQHDQNYQRIIWRDHPSDLIKHYKLTTVTYGTTSAPFLAIRTLHQLAEDEKHNFPKASEIVKSDFYVDDLLTGGNNIEEVYTLQSQLITLLSKGGFNLRKWTSNHELLLSSIPEQNRETKLPLNINVTENIKTLGINWHPVKDSFTYKVKIDYQNDNHFTKRNLLSEISKLFDPIGWVQPCIIIGKIIMQQLWLQKTDWDEEISEELRKRWQAVRNQLKLLEKITIPRWLEIEDEYDKVQIHGFCDASESAFAAAIYLRVEKRGKITTKLLTSKSKVAPLKVISIPRLELCGAVLLCRLMKSTLAAHGWDQYKPFYWTDSTIVLHWLQNQPSKWKTFICNRVSEIQTSSSIKQWNHVNGKSNPADIASRGILPQLLVDNELWWNGPAWLREDSHKWPKPTQPTNLALADIELKPKNTCLIGTQPIQEQDLTARFSSFTTLIRVIARCKRWHNKINSEWLTATELQEAEKNCVRAIQQQAFSIEINKLAKNELLPKNSTLIRLKPFLDSEQLLRVGGRIQQSSANESTKHQIILPRGHFANLIIKHYHHLTLHGGSQLVLATIREKYWIVNGLTAIKTLVRKCITCYKINARPSEQLMGELPRDRVTPGKPFAKSGLDYAGPIIIKWGGGRGSKTIKAYVAIFVCFSTKAVHLELVSDLTSNACIAAMRRFIARRGLCHTLISDNGRNFVKADKTLQALAVKMIAEAQEVLANNRINWKFIPPGSPHFGGLWETGVKSMKRHLIKAIGSHLLNVEEMYTVLAQIEACMNSRPLTPVSDDPNDLTALTPGHFLTGENLFELPEEKSEDKLAKKWNMIQKIKQQFWKRWNLEYLTQLQQRAKWFTENRKINVNDLVLIKLENLVTTKWPMGRITALHPGPDNLVRVATVKTARGINKYPIVKLCPLPKQEQNEESTTTTTSLMTLPVENAYNNSASAITSKPSKRICKGAKFMAVLLTMLICFSPTNANYTIKHPESGIYVEHLGDIHLIRGHLKIDATLQYNEITKDWENINQLQTNMSQLCERGLELNEDIQCTELIRHLNHEANHTKELIKPWKSSRAKRGLLGKLLTAVFGVNDEVYSDLETLDANQHQLGELMKHQGNVLLATTAKMNESQQAMTAKINHLVEKINHVGEVINDLSSAWMADQHRVMIQFLSAFQLATAVIEEMRRRYEALQRIQSGTGNLADICSTRMVNETINAAQMKLGSALTITLREDERPIILRKEKSIQVIGFYLIIERKQYEAITTIGIPHATGQGKFTVIRTPSTFYGINYDDQTVFDITKEELSQCHHASTFSYYCSINMLNTVKGQTDCIISHLFNHTQEAICNFQHFSIANKTLIWKQLYRENSWLVLSSGSSTVSLICSGHRTEIYVEDVNIIQIEPYCYMKTNTRIIKGSIRANAEINIKATYFQPISSTTSNNETYHISTEEMYKANENYIKYAEIQEAQLKEALNATLWRHVKQHSWYIGSIAVTVIIVIVISLIIIIIVCRGKGNSKVVVNTATKWYEMDEVQK